VFDAPETIDLAVDVEARAPATIIHGSDLLALSHITHHTSHITCQLLLRAMLTCGAGAVRLVLGLLRSRLPRVRELHQER